MCVVQAGIFVTDYLLQTRELADRWMEGFGNLKKEHDKI